MNLVWLLFLNPSLSLVCGWERFDLFRIDDVHGCWHQLVKRTEWMICSATFFLHSPSPVTQNCTIIMDLRADQNMSSLLMTNSCGLNCISLNRCFVLCEFLLWAFRVSPGTCLNIWGILYFIVSCRLQWISVAVCVDVYTEGVFFHLFLLRDDHILPHSC